MKLRTFSDEALAEVFQRFRVREQLSWAPFESRNFLENFHVLPVSKIVVINYEPGLLCDRATFFPGIKLRSQKFPKQIGLENPPGSVGRTTSLHFALARKQAELNPRPFFGFDGQVNAESCITAFSGFALLFRWSVPSGIAPGSAVS